MSLNFLRRPTTPARVVGRLGLLAALLVLGLGGYLAWQIGRAATAISSDPLRDLGSGLLPDPVGAPGRPPGLAGIAPSGERLNILLLGYGGAGHDGAFLTDSLMVASIDTTSRAVTLLSIPRDLWVTIPASAYSAPHQGKINEAFAIAADHGDRDGGLRLAVATLEPILGLHIARSVAVDFRAFRSVVNSVGGIDLTVDRSFSAQYPANDDPDVDASWIEVSFQAGPQHMDGETALRFARARYSDGVEGSDFARSARQQKVLLAARAKVAASGDPTQLFGLLDALRDDVRTDLSLVEMGTLADLLKGYDDTATVRAALTTDNVLQSANVRAGDLVLYALHPRVVGWSEVQAYVHRLVQQSASFREDPAITVRATASRATAGSAAASRLQELGFRATVETTASAEPSSTTVGGDAVASVAFLAWYFGGATQDGAGPVIVNLGADWTPPRELLLPEIAPPQTAAPPAPPRSPLTPVPTPTAHPSLTPATAPTPSPSPSGR
jgi:LCP family protein required for cell wall assembly